MQRAKLSRVLVANPRLRAGLALTVLVALGALFSLSNVSLVRAAGAAIAVAPLSGPIPEKDPFSPVWNQAQPATIPLSAQQMYQPGGGGSVAAVRVQALHDGHRIAFLLSWADSTRNDYVTDMPSDAAAIQLPIDPTNLPYQCMGQATSLVNIWQWKAAIEREAQTSDDPHNGTLNLTSNGICKAVDTPGVPPTATSTWRAGRWYVIFARDLAGAGEGTAPLTVTEATNAAFAIWDGGAGETRGMKSVSTWVPVTVPQTAADTTGNLIAMAVTGLAGLVIIVLAWRLIPH